ncbi:MAG: DUF4215 domain-containing protein [Labilithrix sp.]|nr:DUF4215 domain-containing protein [Labilithrix sp.]
MKMHGVLGAAIAAIAIFVGAQGCSATTEAGGKSRCTPGANVFCRCAGTRAEGTKLCKEDGAGFEACTTGGGVCEGGEDESTANGEDELNPGPEEEPVKEEAGPPGSPVESCPGKPTALGTAEMIIDGDTTGAKDDLKGAPGACVVGGGGADHVYRLTPTGSGSLSVKVQGTGAFNPTVYLRTACDDESSQVRCSETTGAGGLEQFTHNVVTGQDYYLVVDGASGSAGKYKLTMKLTTGSFCGDGKVDANEACDDGNKTENDGCSNSCQQVNGDPTTGNGCPGHPVSVWPGRTVTGTGSTTPYGNTFTKTGSSCTVSESNLNAASDHIYEITPRGTGNLKVTLTPTDPTVNLMLVARRTCTDHQSQAANMCANSGAAGAVETMTFPVTSGQKVYVAAEGVLAAKGAYTIKYELQ